MSANNRWTKLLVALFIIISVAAASLTVIVSRGNNARVRAGELEIQKLEDRAKR